MSTRRPRVKPVANLAPRKAKSDNASTSQVSKTEAPSVVETKAVTAIEAVSTNPIAIPVVEEQKKVIATDSEKVPNDAIKEEIKIDNDVKPTIANSRRRIKPAVNIPAASKKSRAIPVTPPVKRDDENQSAETASLSPVVEVPDRPPSVETWTGEDAQIKIDKLPDKSAPATPPAPRHKIRPKVNIAVTRKTESLKKAIIELPEHTDAAPATPEPPCEDSLPIVEKPLPQTPDIDDSVFKSPQYYPNIRNTPNYNRMNAASSLHLNTDVGLLNTNENNNTPPYKDDLKCPLSPTKVRQRIKPTPFFGNRRNSLQGREELDEFPRRQRHLSSSSNHSSSNFNVSNLNSKPINSPMNHQRIRTESACSNASDISIVKETLLGVVGTKQKRAQNNRSEENSRMNAKREFRNRFNGEVPDKTQLTMYDMIYYNPITNPMKNPAIKEEKDRRSSSGSSISSVITKRKTPTPMPQEKKEEETAMPVPQLKIGPDGEIIIDEKSLVIETTSEKEAKKNLMNADIVYDDEFSGTQGFYRRHQRTRDWRPEETIKFYRCLHTIGTDFSLMISLFPQRNRRDLKLKFKKEERLNPGLINKALLNPKAFNIEELEKELAIDAEKLKAKNEAVKKLQEKKSKQKKSAMLWDLKKDTPGKVATRVMRTCADVDFVYENEEVLGTKKAVRKRIALADKKEKKNKSKRKLKENIDIVEDELDKQVIEEINISRGIIDVSDCLQQSANPRRSERKRKLIRHYLEEQEDEIEEQKICNETTSAIQPPSPTAEKVQAIPELPQNVEPQQVDYVPEQFESNNTERSIASQINQVEVIKSPIQRLPSFDEVLKPKKPFNGVVNSFEEEFLTGGVSDTYQNCTSVNTAEVPPLVDPQLVNLESDHDYSMNVYQNTPEPSQAVPIKAEIVRNSFIAQEDEESEDERPLVINEDTVESELEDTVESEPGTGDIKECVAEVTEVKEPVCDMVTEENISDNEDDVLLEVESSFEVDNENDATMPVDPEPSLLNSQPQMENSVVSISPTNAAIISQSPQPRIISDHQKYHPVTPYSPPSHQFIPPPPQPDTEEILITFQTQACRSYFIPQATNTALSPEEKSDGFNWNINNIPIVCIVPEENHPNGSLVLKPPNADDRISLGIINNTLYSAPSQTSPVYNEHVPEAVTIISAANENTEEMDCHSEIPENYVEDLPLQENIDDDNCEIIEDENGGDDVVPLYEPECETVENPAELIYTSESQPDPEIAEKSIEENPSISPTLESLQVISQPATVEHVENLCGETENNDDDIEEVICDDDDTAAVDDDDVDDDEEDDNLDVEIRDENEDDDEDLECGGEDNDDAVEEEEEEEVDEVNEETQIDISYSIDNLVAVAIENPEDSSKVDHEIYIMCPRTGKLSDKPLDLPKDVIQSIVECVL